MKKLVVFLGTMIMAVALALPVYAMGGGMGGGMMGGMMSNSGSGLWNGFQQWQNPGRYGYSPAETGRRGVVQGQRYYGESRDLRNQIQSKEDKLDGLLNAAKPDMNKIRNLHTEIRNLREKLAEEQQNRDLGTGSMGSRYPSHSGNGWRSSGPSGMNGSSGMSSGGGMGRYDWWNR
jgi:Spy/CpxP family protein refolding chaperone